MTIESIENFNNRLKEATTEFKVNPSPEKRAALVQVLSELSSRMKGSEEVFADRSGNVVYLIERL